MLAHYLYGKMPPRPKQFELTCVGSDSVFDGKAVKERHAISLERNGRQATFHFEFIRPEQPAPVPIIVKNGTITALSEALRACNSRP